MALQEGLQARLRVRVLDGSKSQRGHGKGQRHTGKKNSGSTCQTPVKLLAAEKARSREPERGTCQAQHASNVIQGDVAAALGAVTHAAGGL